MRISDGTRQKWLRAFGAELPEAIKPFAEDEQDEHATNGGMLAHPDNLEKGLPLTTAQKSKLWQARTRDRKIANETERRRDATRTKMRAGR